MADIAKLEEIARAMRVDVIESIYAVKSGHPGGSLSAAELVAALYFYKMNIDPQNPHWEDRDRFVLSKGHAAPILYAALAERGYFPKEELMKLRQVSSHLQGAPSMKTPGVDMSAGPLGQGLSAALGMALAGVYQKKGYRVYCMLGDGEIQEGQVWEAVMAAAKFKPGNLVAILDRNRVQMNGTNEDMMPVGDVAAKFEAFGWKVLHLDGNNMAQVVWALDASDAYTKEPVVLIADTIKGKGVSYMEGKYAWHGATPSEEQYQQALEELGVTAS